MPHHPTSDPQSSESPESASSTRSARSAKSRRSREVRSSSLHEIGGRCIGWMMQLIGMTLNLEFKQREQLAQYLETTPVVYALWHNRLFVLPYAWKKFFPERTMVALASASKDGAVVEAAVKNFNIDSARGSSSRRGVAGLVALKKAAQSGLDVAITPDGPRGPLYTVQPGIVKLAQSTKHPIVVVHVQYHGVWTIGSWDKFCIPRPFSTVELSIEICPVPEKLDDEEFTQRRDDLETMMRTVSDNDGISSKI